MTTVSNRQSDLKNDADLNQNATLKRAALIDVYVGTQIEPFEDVLRNKFYLKPLTINYKRNRTLVFII